MVPFDDVIMDHHQHLYLCYTMVHVLQGYLVFFHWHRGNGTIVPMLVSSRELYIYRWNRPNHLKHNNVWIYLACIIHKTHHFISNGYSERHAPINMMISKTAVEDNSSKQWTQKAPCYWYRCIMLYLIKHAYRFVSHYMIYHGPHVVFACLYVTASHYHHYAEVFDSIQHVEILSGTFCSTHIQGLVHERRNSIANALELRLSCTHPSKMI